MADRSEIEWTDATWNPVRGCTKVSPGCKHCYAETFAERWRGIPGHPYEHGFDLTLAPGKLVEPLRWRRPRKIFVNSMSDLFHPGIPDAYLRLVAGVMEAASWHLFQVLTKRADNLLSKSHEILFDLPNVIAGVSVEDRTYGVPRIDLLRQAKVSRRFLSVEPLLGDLGDLDLTAIDWVIVGGESGPGARPMDPAWARRVRDQCAEQGVPFFFKQWGGVQKKKAGRTLDGVLHNAFPVDVELPPTPHSEIQRDLIGLAELRIAAVVRASVSVSVRQSAGPVGDVTDAEEADSAVMIYNISRSKK
ncbi:MAG TPA: phage Gp37/Gp68 family protein [Acidimicrobiia bacterium]